VLVIYGYTGQKFFRAKSSKLHVLQEVDIGVEGPSRGRYCRAYDLADSPPFLLVFEVRILLVDFDEATVTFYSAFPLPRTLVADTIERVSLGNPKVIGLDVILDLPRGEQGYAQLEKAISDSGNVIMVHSSLQMRYFSANQSLLKC
jgi:hypothetical protein